VRGRLAAAAASCAVRAKEALGAPCLPPRVRRRAVRPAHAPLLAPRAPAPPPAADALLAGKAHRELLQPYAAREAEALAYLRAVRPGLRVRLRGGGGGLC
jgi:hypothetical protein